MRNILESGAEFFYIKKFNRRKSFLLSFINISKNGDHCRILENAQRASQKTYNIHFFKLDRVNIDDFFVSYLFAKEFC